MKGSDAPEVAALGGLPVHLQNWAVVQKISIVGANMVGIQRSYGHDRQTVRAVFVNHSLAKIPTSRVKDYDRNTLCHSQVRRSIEGDLNGTIEQVHVTAAT